MCLLTFCPAGIQPDSQGLLRGSVQNNDGHGYAIVHNGRLIIGKGMSAGQVIDEFMTKRAMFPDGPALFHSRFTTHGLTNVENCHPFRVGGDKQTVIAHNGVMPDEVQPRKGDHRSDTRITAESFLPRFGYLSRSRTRQRFGTWMGSYNKVVVLSVNPRFNQQAYIINESSGMWDGGIWYSNSAYKPYVPTRYTYRGPGKWTKDGGLWREESDGWGNDPGIYSDGYREGSRAWDAEYASNGAGVDKLVLDPCWNCGLEIDIDQDDKCPSCGWCTECMEMGQNCFCYSPSRFSDTATSATGWPREVTVSRRSEDRDLTPGERVMLGIGQKALTATASTADRIDRMIEGFSSPALTATRAATVDPETGLERRWSVESDEYRGTTYQYTDKR